MRSKDKFQAFTCWNGFVPGAVCSMILNIWSTQKVAGSPLLAIGLDSSEPQFRSNPMPRRKQAANVGKAALEAARRAIDAGSPPFRNVLVGMVFGGRPVTDYANDFWLISPAEGGDPVGYVTSPWFSPELETNIALGYVPWEMRSVGTHLRVHLPEEYAEPSGEPAAAEVVDVPFRPSVNPNARERARARGRDSVD